MRGGDQPPLEEAFVRQTFFKDISQIKGRGNLTERVIQKKLFLKKRKSFG